MPTLYGWFEWLSRRAILLNVRDPDAELEKLAFIRIFVGLVVLARVLPIVYGSYFYFDDVLLGSLPAATVLGAIVVALVVCVTVGIFTPLALVALLLLYGLFDVTAQTATLGTQILLLLIALLLLTGAGSRRSIDAMWMQRQTGTLGRFVRALYALPGRLDENALRVCYFLVFAAYAVISFGAILLHIYDTYWREGYTLQVMLTSSYLSRAYPLFRELEALAPNVLRGMSIVGSAGQALFQLAMFPLIFTRAGGWFAALWGLGFFLASAFLLELSYLPHLEILLWGALFVRTPSRNPIAVYYDDYCNLCKRTMQTLRAVDVVGTFQFRPVSKNAEDAARYGIELDQLGVSLHGVFRERVYVGYELYFLITRRAPLLWIFAPVLWLLRAIRVGPAVYETVARNRRRMFGTCEIAYDANRGATARFALPASRFLAGSLGTACGVFVALIYGTLFLRLPDLDSGIPRAKEGIYRLGFEVPNVFNETDLKMSDQWPVIYRQLADSSWQIVPLHAPDGQKLLYPRLVDILYFGNSLPWRRRVMENGGDVIAFARPGGVGDSLVQRVIAFDERMRGVRGGHYRVEIYRKSGSDTRRHDRAKYIPQLVYSYEVHCRPEPFPGHSERSEESRRSAQDRLRGRLRCI
jgi:predicted DCC family thiol-disulfide oxidoreductase YuxK